MFDHSKCVQCDFMLEITDSIAFQMTFYFFYYVQSIKRYYSHYTSSTVEMLRKIDTFFVNIF